jgi:hypothetical protein
MEEMHSGKEVLVRIVCIWEAFRKLYLGVSPTDGRTKDDK